MTNMNYELMSFEKALANLHEDAKNDQISYMTNKTWYDVFGCVIGFNPTTKTIGVYNVNIVNNTIKFSHNYHLSITDMDENWYYFADEESVLKFFGKE